MAGNLVLLDAVYRGASKRVSEIISVMEESEADETLTTFDMHAPHDHAVKANLTVDKYTGVSTHSSPRSSLVVHACLSGNVDVFDTVLKAMEGRLTKEQVDGCERSLP